MLRVGLTGGIGSGKSTVAKIFAVLGVPVYYADDAAKRLMNEHAPLRQELIRDFGADLYPNGGLDRKLLASRVFSDAQKLARLNSIVHPVTLADAEQWMRKQKSPYAIKEAALIFESGAHASLDHVIGVYSPEPLRISRAMKRDGLTREQVKERMEKQLSEEIKLRLCDTVIINDGSQLLIPQVIALHEKLSAIAVNS